MLSLIRYVIEMLYGWIFTVEICTIIQNYFRTKLECSVALFYFNYISLRDLIWSHQRYTYYFSIEKMQKIQKILKTLTWLDFSIS